MIKMLIKHEQRCQFMLMTNQLQPLVALIVRSFHDSHAQVRYLCHVQSISETNLFEQHFLHFSSESSKE